MGAGVCFNSLILGLSYSEGDPTGALHTGPLQNTHPFAYSFSSLQPIFTFRCVQARSLSHLRLPCAPHPNMNQLPSLVKSAAEICLNAAPPAPRSVWVRPSGSLQDNGSGVLKDPLPSQLLMPIPPSNLHGWPYNTTRPWPFPTLSHPGLPTAVPDVLVWPHSGAPYLVFPNTV